MRLIMRRNLAPPSPFRKIILAQQALLPIDGSVGDVIRRASKVIPNFDESR